jgi:hypothetical protein
MQKRQNNKKASKPNTSADGRLAYTNAQKLLRDLKKGFIPYDNIFASSAEALAAFPRLISGDLLNMIGHQFYWKRQLGKPLILYGQSTFEDEVQKKGLVEICRFRVPDAWIGIGRFKIDWPEMEKKDDQTPFLITLYLYSTNTLDFDYLISNDDATAAFMACLFLVGENAKLFDELAEERFTSLS